MRRRMDKKKSGTEQGDGTYRGDRSADQEEGEEGHEPQELRGEAREPAVVVAPVDYMDAVIRSGGRQRRRTHDGPHDPRGG